MNFFELAQTLVALHDADVSQLRELPLETGMSRRRLYYLLEVGRLIATRRIAKSEAEAIGWTKLQIIARHVLRLGIESTAELKTLLETARVTKVRPLRALLSGLR